MRATPDLAIIKVCNQSRSTLNIQKQGREGDAVDDDLAMTSLGQAKHACACRILAIASDYSNACGICAFGDQLIAAIT